MNKFVEYCLDRVYILQQATGTLKNCHRWAVEEMYKLVYTCMWLIVGYLSVLISVI